MLLPHLGWGRESDAAPTPGGGVVNLLCVLSAGSGSQSAVPAAGESPTISLVSSNVCYLCEEEEVSVSCSQADQP